MLSVLLTLIAFAFVAFGLPIIGPVFNESFPDPTIIFDDGTWYAFATSVKPAPNLPAAVSKDLIDWEFLSDHDAMPEIPPWVIPDVQNYATAPDVNKLDDGSYIIYYDAQQSSTPERNCVGVATADHVLGPYTPQKDFLVCPFEQGGAIDPSGFLDVSESSDTPPKRYILYKIDGNLLGNGGPCGNAIAPYKPTPIMLQEVEDDGYTFIGDPIELIDNNGEADQGIVEAPVLIRSEEGVYILFFSTRCFADGAYAVEYATAPHLKGPYTRQGKLMTTGTEGLLSPGGMDVTVVKGSGYGYSADETVMAFHAYNEEETVRQLFFDKISINGTTVSI